MSSEQNDQQDLVTQTSEQPTEEQLPSAEIVDDNGGESPIAEDIAVLDKPNENDVEEENKIDLKLEDLASDNIVTPKNSDKSNSNSGDEQNNNNNDDNDKNTKAEDKAKLPLVFIVPKDLNEKDDDDDDDDEEFEDETIVERLIGLTEMFPETIRNFSWKLTMNSYNFTKAFYEFSRSTMWIISTSAIILAVPVLIETEKSQLEEMNRQQQRQILLGPSASSGPPSLTTPMK